MGRGNCFLINRVTRDFLFLLCKYVKKKKKKGLAEIKNFGQWKKKGIIFLGFIAFLIASVRKQIGSV